MIDASNLYRLQCAKARTNDELNAAIAQKILTILELELMEKRILAKKVGKAIQHT